MGFNSGFKGLIYRLLVTDTLTRMFRAEIKKRLKLITKVYHL